MEVKIGVQYAQRELVVETDESAEAIEKLVGDAVAAGTLITLTDIKGRRIFVPSERLAYVEVGPSTVGHVGFRS